MDYFIDEDGNYVSEINDHRIESLYKLTFVKNINAKELRIITKCPSCGNSLNSNISGLCNFCRNVIDMYEYEYKIKMENLFSIFLFVAIFLYYFVKLMNI